MKINDINNLRHELTQMLHYRWNCLNQLLLPSLIDDIVKFIEQYKNKENK